MNYLLRILLYFLLSLPVQAKTTIGYDSQGYPALMVDGKVFEPRGYNVVIQHQGEPYQSFATFDVEYFNPEMLERNFKILEKAGYNYVRLWLKGYDADNGFGLQAPGISDSYVNNVLLGMQLARRHGLQVVLTGSFRPGVWMPANYMPAGQPSGREVSGINRLLLLPAMAQALGDFYENLLTRISEMDNKIISSILYFDLYNELHFDLSQPPFERMAGKYVYAGQTYDLAIPGDRQALMDAAGRQWLRTMAGAIHRVEPDLLITASSFPVANFGHRGFDGGKILGQPQQWKPYPLRPSVILAGGANLIDIHLYTRPAGNNRSRSAQKVVELLARSDITPALTAHVPLILGEFGSKDLFISQPDKSLPEMETVWQALCPLRPAGYALWVLRGSMAQQTPGGVALLHRFGAATPHCPR
ncbi:hypothetical protein [Teichococcus aestuarii]|uniref:hypothetical protein n=1 Tax=Teichococcus aestuarii TaxID=568898 RepID=UPI00360FEE05